MLKQQLSKYRIKIDQKYDLVYNGLAETCFTEAHQVFTFCASLGYLKDFKKKLIKPMDKFFAHTFKDNELGLLYGLFCETNNKFDYSKLLHPDAMVGTAQEYANGGMEIFIGDCLCHYLKNKEEKNLKLFIKENDFFEKEVTDYILENLPK